MTISYQGIKGAYSYIASRYLFPEAQLLGKGNFRQVYASLVAGESQAAVLPIENTVIGSIFEVYDLLFEHSDVEIIGELQLKIDHNIIGFAAESQTSNLKHQNLAHLRELYSHEKALKQCQNVLAELGWVKPVVWEDTAAAAAYVSLKHDSQVAAIASKTAAKLYGLEVLLEKVQDNDENYTRFCVLQQKGEILRQSGSSYLAKLTQNDKVDLKSLSTLSNKSYGSYSSKPTGLWKTSLVFAASHTPGSLMECMQPFAKAGLNLTKIQSRPLIGRPWQYLFYLDFEHKDLNGSLTDILEQVKPHTQILRNLGTYPVGETITEPDANFVL